MTFNDAIGVLVFGGVLAFIFAVKTTEAPIWFLFYSVSSAGCFGLVVKFLLDGV